MSRPLSPTPGSRATATRPDPSEDGTGEPGAGSEAMRWGWWVVRDDGDPMEGPYDTEAQADTRLHLMYDRGEYLIERRYTAATSPDRPASTNPVAVAELEAALAKARRNDAM